MKKKINMKSKVSRLLQTILFIFIGLFFCFLLIEGGLRLVGLLQVPLRERANRLPPKKKGEYRILCLGESTTADGGEYSYSNQLEAILNNLNLGLKFTVINEGIIAANSSVILSKLEENLDKYNPDMVVAMMGINDEGIIEYEKAVGIPESGVLKNIKTYKLVKFLIKNITDITSKNDSNIGEDLDTLPKNDHEYVEWGWNYLDQGKINEAQKMFEKAITINPRNDEGYVGLGWMLRLQGKINEAQKMLEKGVNINPRNTYGHLSLAKVNAILSPDDPGKKLMGLEKAVKINPFDSFILLELGRHYWSIGKLQQAEQAFIRSIEVDGIETNEAYIELAEIYRSQGKTKQAEQMLGKVAGISTMRADNCQKLHNIINNKDIQLVAVQYPLRNIDQLKDQLPTEANVIFVDNEQVFEEAVEKKGYQEYFYDRFAGDFGHCTDEGNRLLAENIANTILRECRECFEK